MNIWIDFFRVAIPLLVLLVALPALAARIGAGNSAGWPDRIATSVLRTALFLVLLGILIGKWRLYLSGIVAVLYIAWILGTVFFSSPRRWRFSENTWHKGYSSFLRTLERRELIGKSTEIPFATTQGDLFAGLLAVLIFGQFLWFPLNNIRFTTAYGYASSLSLGALTNGLDWRVDASTALLAPLVLASGLDVASVIRLSIPLSFLLLLAAIAYCARSYSKSPWAGAFALVLFWLYCRNAGFEAATAPGGSIWAAFFLILAAGAGRRSIGYSACGLLLAWLLDVPFPELFGVALGCILAGLLADGFLLLTPQRARSYAIAALVLFGALSLTMPLQSVPAEGPLQYESAARAAAGIAREFPRNQWLIISPMHEMALTAGRGWHMELPQFLTEFQVSTVSRPEFRFPYETPDVFIFIEKRPLPQTANLAVPGNPVNSFYYSTNPGRASMAFRAAQLIAAYSSSHQNSSTYFEDEYLIVQRIQQ